MTETKATILVVDRKASLVMELRDDSKTTFFEAIGLSTYSNSRAGVLSYVAIFENFWKQSELYQEIKESHDQLKIANAEEGDIIKYYKSTTKGQGHSNPSFLSRTKYLEMLKSTFEEQLKVLGYDFTKDVVGVTSLVAGIR
jgi:hypothetical protein